MPEIYHYALKRLKTFRPVTAEAAGSSPVLALLFQWLSTRPISQKYFHGETLKYF